MSDGRKISLNDFVPAMFIIIVIIAAMIRIDAIYQVRYFSFDESLYNSLGTQLKLDPLNYSPSKYFHEKVRTKMTDPKERARVRSYLDVPLFKHPPLYFYILAGTKAVLGDSRLSSSYVSVFFGIGTIIIVYFLCKNIWDEKWALLATLFMSLEPIYWLCSQKVWVESALGFFVYLGILLLVLGERNKAFIYLSGISLGLALLCKYPAILAIIPVYMVVLFSDSIKSRKSLLIYILIPFVLSLPWAIWNHAVYGNKFILNLALRMSDSTPGGPRFYRALTYISTVAVLAAILIIAVLFKIFYKKTFNKVSSFFLKIAASPIMKNISLISALASVCVLIFISHNKIFQAFNWYFFQQPIENWRILYKNPKFFYFYHMIELGQISIFAYLSVIFFKRWDRWVFLFALIVVSFFVFFGFYGYYESRLVIVATPALMILATYTIKEATSFFQKQSGHKRTVPIFLMSVFIFYIVLKMAFYGFFIIAKNNFAFF